MQINKLALNRKSALSFILIWFVFKRDDLENIEIKIQKKANLLFNLFVGAIKPFLACHKLVINRKENG
jgi:hypothetical protein